MYLNKIKSIGVCVCVVVVVIVGLIGIAIWMKHNGGLSVVIPLINEHGVLKIQMAFHNYNGYNLTMTLDIQTHDNMIANTSFGNIPNILQEDAYILQQDSFMIGHIFQPGVIQNDTIYITTNAQQLLTFPNFQFYNLYLIQFNNISTLSFAHTHRKGHSDQSLPLTNFIQRSIPHIAYNNNYTNTPSFGIGINNNNNNNMQLSLGIIPKMNMPYHAQCDIVDAQWACSNISISLLKSNNEIKYEGDYMFTKAVFQTNTDHIYVSGGFMDFLYLHIFGELIDKEICVYVYGDSETQELTCGCSDLESFPNFVFNISGITFTFNGIDLFSKRGALCYFVIKEKGSNNPDKEGIVIGSKFYEKYYTEFDYDNNKIHFSSKTAYTMYNDTNTTITSIKFILIVIILILNISNLIYYFIFNKYNMLNNSN
jgi:hypothetical protein